MAPPPMAVLSAGSWVQNFTADYCVEALHSLSGRAALPTPAEPISSWLNWALSVATAPMIMLFAGSVIAALQSPLHWCCQPRATRQPKVKVACRRLLALWSAAVAVLGAGVAFATIDGMSSYRLFAADMERCVSEVEKADSIAQSMKRSGISALSGVQGLVTSCPEDLWPFMREVVKKPANKGHYYLSVVREYAHITEKLPALVEELKGYLVLAGSVVVAVLALPLALLALVLLGLGLASLAARSRACCRWPGNCCVTLVPLVILVVAGSTCVSLLMGSSIASVCAAPAGTLVSYPGHIFGFESKEYNLTRYYIEGLGSNDALDCLGRAEGLLGELTGQLSEYSQGMAATCMGWNAAVGDLEPLMSSLQENIVAAKGLIEPRSIYAYYEQTLRENICGLALRTLSIAVFLQASLAFILLPALAAAVQSYLTMATHEAQAREMGQSAKMAEQKQIQEGLSGVQSGLRKAGRVEAWEEIQVVPTCPTQKD
eukprot:gb/GFBE01004119.1/.p1 GENE.gb/GFBE01004119.1/~~gb/GFBE01004119.1/.p1  ORF type:complete len:488 (+),score=100.40 gb/GFBE01004119.1/:1-1464(+)